MVTPMDLLILKEALWPRVTFYRKQIEVIEASVTARETYVTAGNDLGKDFVAAFIAIGCFLVCLSKGVTCRIVTTSVAEHHLKVLWGEIGRFTTTSSQNLILAPNRVGPLVINYMEIRRAEEALSKNPLNYLVGRVSKKDEGLAGHHAKFTMLIGDEASGLDDRAYTAAQGWAKHMLFIGNPNPTNNFFRRAVKAGNLD